MKNHVIPCLQIDYTTGRKINELPLYLRAHVNSHPFQLGQYVA